MSKIPPLTVGRKYYVEYKIPGVHRKKRSMVATFLGVSGEDLVFSGRPTFGTAQIYEGYCLMARGVDSQTIPHTDRMVP